MPYDYKLLRVELLENRIAWVTVDAPPINVIMGPLYAELSALSKELKADANLSVVVLKSADPDFLLAHFDVSLILQFPTDEPAQRDPELNDYHAMCERFPHNGQSDDRADRRARGRRRQRARVVVRHALRRAGQDEDQSDGSAAGYPAQAVGYATPAASSRPRPRDGDHHWRRRSRCRDRGAVGLPEQNIHRERNRPLRGGVGASHCDVSGGSRAHSRKESINNAEKPLSEALPDEAFLFQRTLRTEGAQRNMRRFLEMGGQTREGELKVGELMAKVAKP